MGFVEGFKSIFSTEPRPSPEVKAASTKNETVIDPGGRQYEGSILKPYMPNFLYRPPFGFPRNQDVIQLRKLSQNAYVHSIITTIQYQVSGTKRDLRLRPGKTENEALKQRLTDFFENPNGNDESMDDLLRKLVRDILVLESGVWVKVFDAGREFKQLIAADGGTFLKNPNPHGYIGGRAEFVDAYTWSWDDEAGEYRQNPRFTKEDDINTVKEEAAYFQYGWGRSSVPVPFGRREIMWFSANPTTDDVYSMSPVQILGNVLLTLLYGATYNLDFYLNSNMPDGVLEMLGANKDEIRAFRERWSPEFTEKDILNNNRKVFNKFPIVNIPTKFTPFQLSSKDMEVLAQQAWFWKLCMACFGVTPSEMGFTEDSNKATEVVQSSVFKRKAVAPLLKLIAYRINMQLMTELDPSRTYEFFFDDYDLAEDLKKHELYQMQIAMGIKTPEMVAEEEGIDVAALKKGKEEARQQRMEEESSKSGMAPFGGERAAEKGNAKTEASVKSNDPVVEGELGAYLQSFQEQARKLTDQLDFSEGGA
jgi:phage portal protein BeeE